MNNQVFSNTAESDVIDATDLLNDIKKTAMAMSQGFRPAPTLIGKRDVARRLGCSEVTVNRLLRRGAISYVRVGRLVKFSEAHLAGYLSRQERRAVMESVVKVS